MSESDPSSDTEEVRSLLILYATETGNAQDAADYIARECRRIRFQCRVASVDSYSLTDLISENIVVFVVSTTGSGVEPRSMTPLWTNLLRSDLPPDTFEDLPYTVFGLGDTGYEKFCWPAKKLSRRLQSLGATEFHERGEADEQHPLGIDGALQPWTESLLKKLLEIFPLPSELDPISVDKCPPPRVLLKNMAQSIWDSSYSDSAKTETTSHKAFVKVNNRITAQDWFQDVRHIELDFEDDIKYDPGDVVVIHPVASFTDLQTFLRVMGWEDIADAPFSVEQRMFDQSLPSHLPRITTLKILFSRFLDFKAVPRRSFFQYLRYFITDELEREKLDEFLSREGADELYEYCYRVRRTILEVLSEFRHVQVPKDYVFDMFPPLRPREFSIASSFKRHPRQVHLCVAIVKYRTKLKVPRRGVCTSYLSSLQLGSTIEIEFKKGLIRLPRNPETPLICIGPGTGVAPMRSVIEDRLHGGSNLNFLYFGCRSASKDQHYASEWRSYSENQQMHYRAAFSRDGPEGEKRTYVQDLIRQDSEQIWKLVGEQKGWVLISGSSNKMPAAVKEAIAFAAETHGGFSAEEAKRYVHSMTKEGRLIEECWS